MNYRTASLFASAALAAVAVPASAQQAPIGGHYEAQPVEAPTDTYSHPEGEWREDHYDRRYATGADWASPRGGPPPRQDRYPDNYRYDYPAYSEYQGGWSPADREAWLADCRAAYYDYDDGRGDGGLIGSVLGAVIGGVAGNRIADGERLAGTLIGVGVGGIAGAVIGAAIAAAGDDDEYYGVDECEDYLARQQTAWRTPAPAYDHGYYAPMAYAYPVMMVRVPIQRERRHHTHGPECYEWVEEEVVVEEAPAPAPLIRREIPAKPTKLAPIK